MAIERISMSDATTLETGGTTGEPKPVVPESRGSGHKALRDKLVSRGEPIFQTEGNFINVIDSETDEVIGQMDQIAGGQVNDPNDDDEIRAFLEGDGNTPPTEASDSTEEEGAEREIDLSYERGRWLAEEVVKFRITMTNEERYNETNGPIYAQRIRELQEYVDELCRVRNDPDPFGPHKRYPRATYVEVNGERQLRPPEFPDKSEAEKEMDDLITRFRGQYQIEGSEQLDELKAVPTEDLPPLPNPEDENRTVDARRDLYARTRNNEDRRAAESDLQTYFRHAKNHGLLGEVDATLNLAHQELAAAMARGDGSITQLQAVLDQRIARIRRFAEIEFQEKSAADPSIPAVLEDVGEAYIDWAERRLQRVLNRQTQTDYREGEWLVPTPEQAARDRKETFWQQSGYLKYYQITARNEQEFLIAKETFLQMIMDGSIGRSPTAIFEHVKNFIEAFSVEGRRHVTDGNIGKDFLINNRLELEAMLYVFVGNYANEVYQPEQREQAMMAMSMDEGPSRWVALYRAGKGGIAAFTHVFDVEEVMHLYNNPFGERGELNTVAGHFLQDKIEEMVIERGMGRVLKDYDPRDEFFSSNDLQAKIEAAADLERIRGDLKKVEGEIRAGRIKLKPGETARDRLYENEEKGQQKRGYAIARLGAFDANLKRLGLTKSDAELKSLYESFDTGDYHIKNYLSYKADLDRFTKDQKKPEDQRQYERQYKPFSELPESIRRSIDLGRIQDQLQTFRQAILDGRIKSPRGESAVDLLSSRDRQVYQAAYGEASANFDIAFQMQGVLGEKARRGRGYLMSERNLHIRYYLEVGDWLRMKKKDINDPAVFNELRDSLNEASRRSFDIGWMLSKMRDLKSLETFSKEQQEFYKGLNPKDKLDFVDHIPTYLAENFVQWGLTWVKMKYAEAPANLRRAKVREVRRKLIEELRIRGFGARLLDDELGSDGQPKPMIFKRPLGTVDSNTGKFIKFKNNQVLGYNEAGEEVKLSFDESGAPTGLEFDGEGRLIVYDKDNPDIRQRVNYDGINKNTKARLVRDTFVEDVVATFQIAAQSNDFRNRYTDHTYWYYQGNNKDTILDSRIRAAAERIMTGVSRWEDEDILATALLTVDPTLRRVREMNGSQKQQREVTLVGAAVLESFQDRQKIKHFLYKAFLPRDGFVGRMNAGYRNEDWAGMDRFTFGLIEMAAQQKQRMARRMGAFLHKFPMEHDSGPARWGVHGVGGAVKAMADEIKKVSKQGILGQFGLTKIFKVFSKVGKVFNHIAGFSDPQTGTHVFGIGEKPTDNNEKMHEFYKAAEGGEILSNPTNAIPFLYKFRECFGRLIELTHDMREIFSDVDNSAGALNLEEIEIFLPDGSFNTKIETDKSILNMNGNGRNRVYAFLYGEESKEQYGDYWVDEGDQDLGYYGWLQDDRPGGGSDMYPREKYWNKYLSRKFPAFDGTELHEGGVVQDWMTEKNI